MIYFKKTHFELHAHTIPLFKKKIQSLTLFHGNYIFNTRETKEYYVVPAAFNNINDSDNYNSR